MSLVPSASLFYVYVALAIVGSLGLSFIERKRIAAWFTRVKGTQGAQKALSDADAMEKLADNLWTNHLRPTITELKADVEAAKAHAKSAVTTANSVADALDRGIAVLGKASFAATEPNPAAPTEPASAPVAESNAGSLQQPSTGSGGTAPVAPATAADAVTSAHAALDATIAHHQARVDAAKDAKVKLTASTVTAAAEAKAVADPVPQA